MDNPTNNQNTGTEQVPHSGNLPDGLKEQPVNDYDKTSLQAAYALTDDSGEYVIKTPSTVAELIPKKSKNKLFITLGATAAGILVASGAIFGINAINNDTDTPKGGPVAEAPADPSEPAAPIETEAPVEEAPGFEVFGLPTVAEIEISANQTDEQIAENLISVISQWGMTGANREMMVYQTEGNNGDNGYLSLSEFLTKVGEQVNPVFEEALYGENASNPEFQEAIALQEKTHAEILGANYQTYGSQNAAPYYQKLNFDDLDGAFPNDDGTTTLLIGVHREDNGDENIVAGSANGYEMEATLIYEVVDGKVKLAKPPTFVAN